MRNIIHWRSHQNRGQYWLWSLKNIRWSWSEYENLRVATPYDDARDIAWKKSTKNDTLYVKSREDVANLAIRLIRIRDKSWGFTLEAWDDKDAFYRALDRACKESMAYYRYSYDISSSPDIRSSVDWVLQKKINKNTILYTVSELDLDEYSYLSKLSKLNDVIIIHLLHPYEVDPCIADVLLSESQSIKSIQYKEALLRSRLDIRKYLVKNNIAYIPALSTDNPVNLINHFFKYRYAR
jgi:uncharacterized protein (DUF58 family)